MVSYLHVFCVTYTDHFENNTLCTAKEVCDCECLFGHRIEKNIASVDETTGNTATIPKTDILFLPINKLFWGAEEKLFLINLSIRE